MRFLLFGFVHCYAAALSLSPSDREKLSLERIEGLKAWLSSMKLEKRQKEVEAWGDETDATTLDKVKAGASELARRLSLAPKEREALGLEKIEGLAAWLATVELGKRVADVEKWCEKNGAAKLEECQQQVDKLATALKLEPKGRVALGLEPIEGLRAWLASKGLQERQQDVEAWCEKSTVKLLPDVSEERLRDLFSENSSSTQ